MGVQDESLNPVWRGGLAPADRVGKGAGDSIVQAREIGQNIGKGCALCRVKPVRSPRARRGSKSVSRHAAQNGVTTTK